MYVLEVRRYIQCMSCVREVGIYMYMYIIIVMCERGRYMCIYIHCNYVV